MQDAAAKLLSIDEGLKEGSGEEGAEDGGGGAMHDRDENCVFEECLISIDVSCRAYIMIVKG